MMNMIDIGRMPFMHRVCHIRNDTGLDPVRFVGLTLDTVLFSKFPTKGANAKDYH